ncbi:hypothetical protein [Kordia jejudonensis]|uniref:hypothetical protein n=1 Tax=Kordia jejudonensis TaxID=1348245 RepID=UPI0012E0A8CB|nr:hypothetical protein [Kordia jejudonensis]
MLDKLANLEGLQYIAKKGQRNIIGGAPRFCNHRRPCDFPYACYQGICRLP